MLTLPDLINYLESIHPGFRATIRGATPTVIAELERLAERRLPDIHREFLALMGGDLGGVCDGFVGGDFRAEALLDHFRENGWRPPEPFVLIGADIDDLPMDTFLRCAADLVEPEVVQFTVPGGERVSTGPCCNADCAESRVQTE